jgi:hypothetical protein
VLAPRAEAPMDDPDVSQRLGEPVTIANEFAIVTIQKVLTRNGERLEISAPKLHRRILLDPVELESLSWQTHDTFSRMLETPFGPDR